MNLTISGNHLELTPAIREYVQTKLERITRHFDELIDISVILGVEQLGDKTKRQRAEINLNLKGKTLHLESFAQDMYAAIDTLIDKVDRQVLRYKEQLKKHQHEPLKKSHAESSIEETPAQTS